MDFTKIFQLKGLKPKNKDHTNFYECFDLRKKVHISNLLLFFDASFCVCNRYKDRVKNDRIIFEHSCSFVLNLRKVNTNVWHIWIFIFRSSRFTKSKRGNFNKLLAFFTQFFYLPCLTSMIGFITEDSLMNFKLAVVTLLRIQVCHWFRYGIIQ